MGAIQFKPWNGGSRPVGLNQLVVVKLKSANRCIRAGRASEFTWNKHMGYGEAVVAYAELRVDEVLEDGFIRWYGGPCPVPLDYQVRVRLRGYTELLGPASTFRWSHASIDGDIVAYKVLSDSEGFTPWTGGPCPVEPDAVVVVKFSDGTRSPYYLANGLNWGSKEDVYVAVQAYKVVPMSEWVTWTGGDCPLASNQLVQVRLAGGDVMALREAGEWHWSTERGVAAYRTPADRPVFLAGDRGEILWNGGACPVQSGVMVRARLRSGSEINREASRIRWEHLGLTDDVVAYWHAQIDEGFVPWHGGVNPAGDLCVEILMRDGGRNTGNANYFRWDHTGVTGDILYYRVINDD